MARSVSWYSFLSAMIFFSIALVVILVLRSRTGFLKRHGVSILLLAVVLALVRLMLPLDLPAAYICRSWLLFPAVMAFFQKHAWTRPLLSAAWGTGTAAVLARDIQALIHARTACGSYLIVEAPRVNQIAERISIKCPVRVSPDVDIPYVAGLFRHTIYLPNLELSDREIELILMHENQHIRSHDSQIKLFWGLLSAVFWWNPAIYQFRKEIDALLEFRCDANVTKSMDLAGRIQYLETLLNIMKQAVDWPGGFALSLHESSTLSSGCVAEQRFAVIADNLGKQPPRVSLAVKCVLLGLFLASYLIVLQPASLPAAEAGDSPLEVLSEMEKTSGEIDRAICAACIIRIGNKYYLFVEGRQEQELSVNEVLSDTYKDYIIMEECVP